MTDGTRTPASFDTATLSFYAAEAPAYVAAGRNEPSRHLNAFLDRLRPGARILELGCGAGRDAEAMLARGFQIDPTDAVPEMAAEAAALLGLPVRTLRFDQLAAVDRYDAIWAHASLLHVPRASLAPVLARIRQALKPGGWHFASYKAGGGEGRDRFGRYFNYPSADQLVGLYRQAASWEEVSIEEYAGGGLDGEPTAWIAITAQR